MQSTGRLFKCVLCFMQVIICSSCDRGQRYCSSYCSNTVRSRSQKAASYRYQQSRQGKLNHARRMRHYRYRKQIVTHQGSPSPGLNDLLQANPENAKNPVVTSRFAVVPEKYTCHFCGHPCSEFVRLAFLHRRRVHYLNPFDLRGNRHDYSP